MGDGRQYWSMTEAAFHCLIDQARTRAFEKAIRATVQNGDVAVDAGTGTGILAMFAADAGAIRVYAIEGDPAHYESLVRSIRRNGYDDTITILQGDASEVALPEPVDVIICEMISTGLIEELQIPVMNNLLKYGREGVKPVLAAFENYVDLVHNNNVFYGHPLEIIRYEFPDCEYLEEPLESTPLTNKAMYGRVEFTRFIPSNTIRTTVPLSCAGGGNQRTENQQQVCLL